MEKHLEDRNVSCVHCNMLFDSLALSQTFYYCSLSRSPQTNSHTCLIKSSIENVFVERKEIFRAENTFADNSRPFVFLKRACCLSLACVCWLMTKGIYFQQFFFSSSCKAVALLLHWYKLTVKQRQGQRSN